MRDYLEGDWDVDPDVYGDGEQQKGRVLDYSQAMRTCVWC